MEVLEAREQQFARDKQQAVGREALLLDRDKDAEKERQAMQESMRALEEREGELLHDLEAVRQKEQDMSRERNKALQDLEVRAALLPATQKEARGLARRSFRPGRTLEEEEHGLDSLADAVDALKGSKARRPRLAACVTDCP